MVSVRHRLLAALREPDRTVVQLALECGARLQSELLPVVWSDIDLDKARLTITATHAKNGRPRHLPLSADMVARLREMQATSASRFVFAARGGGFFHRFAERYYGVLRALGLTGPTWPRRTGLTSTACDIAGRVAWSSQARI